MKKHLLTIISVFSAIGLFAQTNLISNGSFDTSPFFANWSSNSGANIWGGAGACGGNTGTGYCWMSDQNETTGLHNIDQDIYQNITIPSNTIACSLWIDVSINTNETTTTQEYDLIEFSLETTGGTFLTSLGNVSNLQGAPGITNCQPWASYYSVIPSTYFGQTVRLKVNFITDGSVETILRIDDIEVLADQPCNYNLSTGFYNLASANAGTFSSISSVNTASNCPWTADVTSGSSWLSTSSAGPGNGDIDITVTANPTINARAATIDVEGSLLTIEQPGKECEYSLGIGVYNCPDHLADNYDNITIVNADDGCSWTADVVQGEEWLICNSNATGNGTLSISVTGNTTEEDRTGQIVVQGETLLVVQPKDFRLTGINELSSEEVSVYPVPFNDQLQVQVSERWANANVVLFNQLGAVVYRGFISSLNEHIDLKELEAGTYFLEIKSDESSYTEKIIKL